MGVWGKVAIYRSYSTYGGPMTERRESSHTERREFISAMAKQRKLLVLTVRGLSEEQIRLRPTASALCLGGLLAHVTTVEESWSNFITQGSSAIGRSRSDQPPSSRRQLRGDK